MLLMTAYDDYALSKWVEEHPADLFHLMQSNVQWTFYLTKFIEFLIFAFALWRSKRVTNKKLDEKVEEIESNQAESEKTNALAMDINNNIHSIRLQFFNQLFWVGSIYFGSLPFSTILSVNLIQESSQQMM